MDIIKEFMKIGGFKTPEELEAYGEERFFNDFPQARKYAKGGEAYPQTATMDKFFSYGVPVPPTYYATGGAFPMAQPENIFFSPAYGNVYNPYNKAMGGSQEAFPQAIPYGNMGTSKAFYFMQDGGQDPNSSNESLDRMGVLNRTGSYASILKKTAANSNAKKLMSFIGKAKYGKELNTYQDAGSVNNQEDDFTSKFNTAMDAYIKKITEQRQPQAPNMNSFYPSLYNWNDPNHFIYTVSGSPGLRWNSNVPGMGKQRGKSNMSFYESLGKTPEERVSMMQKYNITMEEKPKGLFGKRTQRTYTFGPRTENRQDSMLSAYGPYAEEYKFAPENIEIPSKYGPYAENYKFADNSSTNEEMTFRKYGGSYKQGDVVYMSDDEIAEFIKNGGQIEEME